MKRVVVESPLAPRHEWKTVGNDQYRCYQCGQQILIWGDPPLTVGDCLGTKIKPCSFKFNIRYAQLCLLDCLQRGEAPFASHLIYTQVLDDRQLDEREHSMRAGLEWASLADLCVVYQDLGVSAGMNAAIAFADNRGVPVERRSLPTHLLMRLGEDPSLWETLK